MKELAYIDDYDSLPPEVLLDPYHPTADEYIKNTANIQRMTIAVTKLLKPKQVKAIKMHYAGKTLVQIAGELKCTPQSVGKWVNSHNGKRLVSLLQYYQLAVDGPCEAQRRNMLWRIAVDNEKPKPNISIAAHAELTRMSNLAFDQSRGGNPNQPIIININQDTLPKGALDV